MANALNLPDLGGAPRGNAFNIDPRTLEQLDKYKRLLIDRDFNPELNGLMENIPMFKNAIRNGSLRFNGEIPGVNSDRLYLGLQYRL